MVAFEAMDVWEGVRMGGTKGTRRGTEGAMTRVIGAEDSSRRPADRAEWAT